ncbi:hypothetical protein LO762_25275 [Actinocorallia sp. API 0066]|uniref:hypothetical protein n=1 Tax=Actinocorallia sp. API 0066 TaxID=2896846 RepID=UPI001E3A9C3F|nr:hypothetical protein [Actinocorallia sp. API 0066]MCD0452472.1 hypothetical protein [Actinocorallia sp. API 0066]
MYLWIWRRLPVRHPAAKAAVALGLVLVAVAALWFWVFPWLETQLAFDKSTLHEGAP